MRRLTTYNAITRSAAIRLPKQGRYGHQSVALPASWAQLGQTESMTPCLNISDFSVPPAQSVRHRP
jgi:hypothetical protein